MRATLLIIMMVLSAASAADAQTFTLRSREIGGQVSNSQVYNGFGCTGANISPQLSWENAPAGTRSFAVTMYDPDAPTGSGWWHWLMFDIPANVRELRQDAGNVERRMAPLNAVQSVNDYGMPGYGGPCPPVGHGLHAYVITVYALRVDKLGLDEKATPALVGFQINANMIQKASIVSYYRR